MITAARMVAFGEYAVDGTASAMKARDYKDATDLVSYGIPGNWIGRSPENGGNAVEPPVELSPCLTSTDRHGVAHTLRGEGFDASEDGTWRGTPIVPVAAYSTSGAGYWRDGIGALRGRPQDSHENLCCVHGTQDPCVSNEVAFALGRNNGQENAIAQPIPIDLRNAGRDPEKYDEINRQGVGVGEPGDPPHTLTTACVHGVAHPIAFSSKDHGGDATEDLSPTLRAMAHADSHANGGGQMAVAVALRGREGGATAELGDEIQNCLRASSGGGDKPHVLTQMAVRRLTPVECERLQGFPDNYTAIPWRKKLSNECPDGPRYKALGNSWAVPNVRWIGRRIQLAVEIAA